MLRKTTLVLIVLAGLLGVAVGSALGTPGSGVSADTAIGPLVDRELNVNMKFDDGSRVRLHTNGPIKLAVQRIVAVPGATFGWHSHPGPTLVTVQSGTLTLYHAEDCTHGINYTAGQSFSNLPWETHLAKNNGSVDLVVFASYFVPMSITVPPDLRINQPLPGAGCPQ